MWGGGPDIRTILSRTPCKKQVQSTSQPGSVLPVLAVSPVKAPETGSAAMSSSTVGTRAASEAPAAQVVYLMQLVIPVPTA